MGTERRSSFLVAAGILALASAVTVAGGSGDARPDQVRSWEASPEALGASEERARALVIEAQEKLRITGRGGPSRPGSPESEADDRLVELRRELVAMGPAAVMALLEAPEGQGRYTLWDWQRDTICRIGGRATPVLEAAVRDPRSEISSGALVCLSQMPGREGARAILDALTEGGWATPARLAGPPFYVCESLAQDPRMVKVLIPMWRAKADGREPIASDTEVREAVGAAEAMRAESLDRTGEMQASEQETAVRRSLEYYLFELAPDSAIERLVSALESSQDELRESAMYRLRSAGPRAADQVAPLIEGHHDQRVRAAVLDVLAHVGVPEQWYPQVIAALNDSDENVQRKARYVFPLMKPETGSPLLIAKLRELDRGQSIRVEQMRLALVWALGRLGDERAAEPLIEIWQDERELRELREAALKALVQAGGPKVGELLEEMSRDPEQAWRVTDFSAEDLGLAVRDPVALLLRALDTVGYPTNRVAWELGRARDPRAVDTLMGFARACLNRKTGHSREPYSLAVPPLGEIGDRRAVPLLLELLAAGRAEGECFPWRAALALGKIGDQRARAPLQELLREAEQGSEDEHWMAVALGHLGDASVIPLLREWMKSGLHGDGAGPVCPDYTYTERAAEALAAIGEPAVPVLLDALDWQYGHTYDYVCLALGRIGDRRAVGPLIEMLSYRWYRARHHAAAALGEIGDPSAIPHLWRAAEDDSGYVRVGAAEALRRLGEEGTLPVITGVLGSGVEDWEREEAAGALGRIGDARAIPALEAALSDRGFEVRRAARKALLEVEEE